MYINYIILHIDISLGGLNITNFIQCAFVGCTHAQLLYRVLGTIENVSASEFRVKWNLLQTLDPPVRDPGHQQTSQMISDCTQNALF